jgi:glycosyltransferase involved in cell wall biosynthesis
MLDKITPIILTFNEAANIRRTLTRLSWAERIVVVDSFSTDETVSILREFANVEIHQRKFDGHVHQWRFAAQEIAFPTPWLLRLDADYVLSNALIAELDQLRDDDRVAAYRIGFDYAIFGRKLAASLYPPKGILFRKGRFRIEDWGHTEGWIAEGPVKTLRSTIVHDDHKPLEHWINSQLRYMEREKEVLKRRKSVSTWLRKHPPLMPIFVFFYCLFAKGLVFRGRDGLYYTLQRTIAEAVLSLLLLDVSLRPTEGIEIGNESNTGKASSSLK